MPAWKTTETRTIETYLASLPCLDPVYFQARKSAYDNPRSPWIRLEPLESYWLKSRTRVYGLPIQGIFSSFGWGIPAWTQQAPKADEDFRALAASVCSLSGWHVAQLNALSADQAQKMKREFEKIGARVFTYPAPVFIIDEFDSYKQYLEQKSKSARRKIRHAYNVLERENCEVRFDELQWPAILSVIDGRKANFKSGPDYTQSAEFKEFFKRLRELLKIENRLCEVGVYDGNNQLIAYFSGFEFNGVTHAYQTASKQEYGKLSLGLITNDSFIQHALNSGRRFIDYMGDPPYLRFYTEKTLNLERLVIYAPNLIGRVLGQLLNFRQRVSRK